MNPAPESGEPPLLAVRDLSLTLATGRRATPLLTGVSFDLAAGEPLGVVGASGAGKSLLARALLGLAPSGARVTGSAVLSGRQLIGTGRRTHQDLWGRRMAFVPQDALAVLNPVYTVGDQLAAAIRSVRGLGRREAQQVAVAALDRVGIADARRRARSYPHEFSGGMRQRAVIAMALVNEPRLVVADEPTTALDPTVQRHVLTLLDTLREETGAALLLISHDLPVVVERASRMLVLDRGRVAEHGPTEEVLTTPRAAATRRLVAATRPRTRPVSPAPSPPLLTVTDLTVRYPGRGRRAAPVTAVDGVSFELAAGETLALVGESGSGKSSTATAVLGLRRPEGGRVLFDGQDPYHLPERELRLLRPAFQPVFQDPHGSLSPRQLIQDAIAEPLRVQGRWHPVSGPRRVAELLELVGLDPEHGRRRPHELSGGQCQRAGIARALAGEPRLLILDEPVSALDPTVRGGVLELLTRLQHERGLAYLFICHDLTLVRNFAHRIAVMRAGRLVETGPVARVLTRPTHSYTRALLDAVPTGVLTEHAHPPRR